MQGKRTRNELLFGIVACCVPIGVVGLLLGGGWVFLFGLLAGMATAMGLSLHMYHCIDVALDLDVDRAQRYGRNRSVVRMMAMAGIIGIAFAFPSHVHPVGVVLGVWTLKAAAYMQPILHKCVVKIFHKKEVD